MKIAIIAGEASGDILGAGLLRALKRQQPQLEAFGVGGEQMCQEEFRSLVSIEELSVMGLIEILKHYPRLRRLRARLIAEIIQQQPDLVVGIDMPDFNLGLEAACKGAGIQTVHYVSPSVWAWRQGRMKTIARSINLMLVLFPFELEIYQQHKVPAICVGHPLADQIPLTQSGSQQSKSSLSETPILALLPGSRLGEIHMLAEPFLKAAELWQQQHPEWQLVMPLVTQSAVDYIRQQQQLICPTLELQVVLGQSQSVMQTADLILLASGTATLEAMLFKKPMVVAYRLNWLTYQIFKRMIRLDYYSLPNLLAQRALVPELIQDEVTAENLYRSLKEQYDADHTEREAIFTEIHRQLRLDASTQAAQAILKLVAD
ncbi:MAG TPA: lipid-A-disaccharide synthase [Gammaproteobacteria bacterium]|nr:lipid-A-disaccharide synthase [Gammaproteobacteria bacterium]